MITFNRGKKDKRINVLSNVIWQNKDEIPRPEDL